MIYGRALPSGWKATRLGDVCREITVGHVGPMADRYEPSGVPFLRSQNILPFRLDLSDIKFIPSDFHAKLKKSALSPGDVAIIRTGYPGTACVIPATLKVANCADLVIARPGDKLDSWFLAAVLNSSWGRSSVAGNLVGVAQQHFNVGAARAMQIALPPLPQQRRIASILSTYDDLMENNRRRIAILEEMTGRIYGEWFVDFRFPGHENVRVVESEFGPVPEGWAVRQLAEVTAYINRGLAPKYDDAAPMLVINQRCIRDQRLELAEARRQSKPIPTDKQVQIGDVLINSTGVGTLGRVAQVLEALEQCTVDTHVSIVRPSKDVDSHFFGLSLLFRQSHFEAAGVGSTGQTELSRTRIAETQIVMPTSEVQREFALTVRPMRELALNLQKKNSNLQVARDLVLPKLISGELDVSSLPEPEAAVA